MLCWLSSDDGAWDPLLQRPASSHLTGEAPGDATAPQPLSETATATATATKRLYANPAPPPPQPKPRPPPAAAPHSQPTSRGSRATSLATETPPTRDSASEPQSDEVRSLALAWQLQQQEQAAFAEAIAAASPRPRARRPDSPDGVPADEEDASLQLALRLQQEELQWQQFQTARVLEQSGTPVGELQQAMQHEGSGDSEIELE